MKRRQPPCHWPDQLLVGSWRTAGPACQAAKPDEAAAARQASSANQGAKPPDSSHGRSDGQQAPLGPRLANGARPGGLLPPEPKALVQKPRAASGDVRCRPCAPPLARRPMSPHSSLGAGRRERT
ncbi:uncharacterized protein TRUGW13939_01274 [Talaromyces rugulosus]|uniref:Uncharacterized protein n=1 Tax=Talaromyces rugulosus TaxID=121627 RepID=A0A7H8QJR9_TALRU|nr:uncharacterized protein TRUGW13939_01274 [Talaromyces rugulosus]QKX54190.1 hypothetical protein TRUGW13939_01274 [Talaromyces rugulosus]